MEDFAHDAAMLIKRRKVQSSEGISSTIKVVNPDFLRENRAISLLLCDAETRYEEDGAVDEPDAVADMGESAADGSGENTVALIKEQIEDTKMQLVTYLDVYTSTEQTCKADLKKVVQSFDAKREKLDKKKERVVREMKKDSRQQLKFIKELREDLQALLEHKENTLKLKMEYEENKKRAAECKERLDKAQKEFDQEQKMRSDLRILKEIEEDDEFSGKKISKKLRK